MAGETTRMFRAVVVAGVSLTGCGGAPAATPSESRSVEPATPGPATPVLAEVKPEPTPVVQPAPVVQPVPAAQPEPRADEGSPAGDPSGSPEPVAKAKKQAKADAEA
jgi:hypothetical protein